MTDEKRKLVEPEILRRAVGDSIRKLNPRTLMKNPVMFVVGVGSVLTTILFFKGNGTDFASGLQKLGFSIIPNTPGAPVPVTWKTFDAGSTLNPVSSGVVTATCSASASCDSVVWGTPNANCVADLKIWNRRAGGSTVPAVVIIVPKGISVTSVTSQAIGWTATPNATHDTMLVTSPTGILESVYPTTFSVSFSGATAPFDVMVKTIDQNQTVCTDDGQSLTCSTKGVSIGSTPMGSIEVSVAPNPFTAQTTVRFELADRSPVSLVLVDVLGHVVETIADATFDGGAHAMKVDASALRPGSYYLRVETPTARATKKLVIDR